ncbi:hypothetical protein I316_04939 [Kwoniella heveanensis BCC8398]|uniref:Uncharacterized protein n=1 Tax=Kwoniella heveanensis BCC8398 TaxID=1296120 RepID=A0A1B9GRC2_9TREE|nr:hypothetical protein I316_04939 [Kwoniella heveanensis BCC8398]
MYNSKLNIAAPSAEHRAAKKLSVELPISTPKKTLTRRGYQERKQRACTVQKDEEVDELGPEEYSNPLLERPTRADISSRAHGATNKSAARAATELASAPIGSGGEVARPTKKAKHHKKSNGEISLDDLLKTLDPSAIGKKKAAKIEEWTPRSTTLRGLREDQVVQIDTPPIVVRPHTLDGFLLLQGRSDLVERKESISEIREFSPPQEDSYEDWRKSKDIRNPRWYLKSTTDIIAPHAPPFPILVASTVLHSIPLMRAMIEEGFDLVEREKKMEEADIVLSACTAVIIHDFATLGHTHDRLFEDLKAAAGFYHRVILIFEVQPFTAPPDRGRSSKGSTTDPLTGDAMRGLRALKKAYDYAFHHTKSLIGDFEIVYAYNGAAEVARAINSIVRQEGHQAVDGMDGALWQETWGSRDWLKRIEPEDWQIQELVAHLGLNTFCAIYAFYRSEGNMNAIEGMSDRERTEEFEAVFGTVIVDRLNRLIREKKEWSASAQRMLPQSAH